MLLWATLVQKVEPDLGSTLCEKEIFISTLRTLLKLQVTVGKGENAGFSLYPHNVFKSLFHQGLQKSPLCSEELNFVRKAENTFYKHFISKTTLLFPNDI